MLFLTCVISRLLFVVAGHLILVLADPPPYTGNSSEYETGGFGVYPELKFQSSELVAPYLNVKTWSPQCESGQYTFIAPRGVILAHPGPMILDQHGHMVWMCEDYGNAYGLTTQQYLGQDYLTFWAVMT